MVRDAGWLQQALVAPGLTCVIVLRMRDERSVPAAAAATNLLEKVGPPFTSDPSFNYHLWLILTFSLMLCVTYYR